jgi:hypothetical protein
MSKRNIPSRGKQTIFRGVVGKRFITGGAKKIVIQLKKKKKIFEFPNFDRLPLK